MQEDFKKINLESDQVADPVKARKNMRSSHNSKAAKGIIIVLVTVLAVFLVGAGILALSLWPLKSVLDKSKPVATSARELAAAFKNQDLALAKEKLAQTQTQFKDLKSEYKKVEKLSILPVIGWYVKDGSHGMKAAEAGLTAVGTAIEALEPNADLLGFKGGGKFVAGTADERIQVAVKTMQALTPKLNEMAGSIEIVRREIDQIDANRYPVRFKNYQIRSRIVEVKSVIDNAANLFVNAQPLLTNLPKILGEPEERRYLVLFQNDKELRPTGGFLTAYAQFRLDGGKMILEKSDDIYTLDAAMSKKFPAPREILTFHKNVLSFYIRDSNLSPDYKLSMQEFEKMYETVRGRENIDGIIAVDTHVLVETLRILGPTFIAGREFSAEIDKRCDCPRAVYELEDYSTRPVGYVREARKDIIGVLLQQIMQKALGVSPSQYWGKLFQMALSEINQKHILAYFHDSDSQKAVESFNMAGRMMDKSNVAAVLTYRENENWDYLHVNNSNMAGAKANMFVSEKITKEVTTDADKVTTKLTIDYKNPYPGSDCGLESGGLCLNAPLRNWLRVYAPAGSKLVESKGTQSPQNRSPKPMDTMSDLGKTVFEGFLVINPLGTAKVELTYTSPVKPAGGKYNLLVQKQPGVSGQEFILKVNNKEQKTTLISDTEFKL